MTPNILITGTPGVGKSKLCKVLMQKLEKNKYKWHDISKFAKENKCIGDYDEVLECPELDEEKLLDLFEAEIAKGGNIVEYHGCDFFPERWFQLVFVIQCGNTVLYDRLAKRNYNEKKIKENIECEIFQTILEEAQDSYDTSIVHALKNENSADLTAAIERISELIIKAEEKELENENEDESEDDKETDSDSDE